MDDPVDRPEQLLERGCDISRLGDPIDCRLKLFGAFAIGDILGNDKPRVSAAELHLLRADFHIDDRAVFQAMSPGTRRMDTRFRFFRTGAYERHIFGGTDLRDPHREKFFAGIAIFLHRRFIHLKKFQGAGIKDPHRERTVPEHQAEALFPFHRRLLGFL